MSKRIGICTNFGQCDKADRKEKVEITPGLSFVCPECQSNLKDVVVTSNAVNSKRIAVIGGGVVILVLIGFLLVKLFSGGSVSKSNEINLSLDQWIGWRSILMANGGLETKPGSYFDKLGLKVHIKNIDDNDAKLNALMSGKLDAMGSTINRYAFEFDKLQRAKVPARMVVVTNTSSGGDGIIAKNEITSIENLVGKKIALARFTEAQCLLEWCLSNSSLTPSQIEQIRKDVIFTDDAGKAGETFFAGKADAAATWQPFISQSLGSTNSHILVDTKTINNFILDGIIFRDDFIQKNPETVQNFVKGVMLATKDLNSKPVIDSDPNYSYLVNSFPMCANLKKSEIEDMFGDAHLSDFSYNYNFLKKDGVAHQVFRQSSSIWKTIGESADPLSATSAIDNSIIEKLKNDFQLEAVADINVSVAQRNAAEKEKAIFTKQLSVNFASGESTILESSYPSLTAFADNIKMAGNSIIQVEGNTDNVGNADANQKLSEKRAKAVGAYLQYQGITPTRFIIIGNGPSKPIADNSSSDGKAKNRRTDIMIKEIK